MRKLLLRLRQFYWKMVPHKHVGICINTKYGGSFHCKKCGYSRTVMW